MPRCRPELALALLLIAATQATAQVERYDLGRRVRAFEAAWDRQPDDAARRRTTDTLSKAVGSFFSFRLGEAGRAMVEARYLLRSAEAPGPEVLWAESLDLRPAKRAVALGEPSLPATLSASYTVANFAPPGSARIVASLEQAGGPIVVLDAPIEIPEGSPQALALNLKNARAGDHTLTVRIANGGQTLAESSMGLSIVDDLAKRLAALEESIAAWPADAPTTTDRETAKALAALIASIAGGSTRETDYPIDRLLGEAEELARSIESNRAYYTAARAGQFWLTLAQGSGRGTPIRIQIPEEAANGPRPMVLALHGAGGSENMFFDAYGDGAIAKLCKARGWFLASPRGNGMGAGQVEQILDEVSRLYPVDKSKIVVVGHSMGAMQAVAAASQSPGRYRAVAALGGGGLIRAKEELANLPWFIGIGDRDFALSGAKSLNAALKQANVKTLEYREYQAIEHLAIVQVALPEVFAFFERSLNAAP